MYDDRTPPPPTPPPNPWWTQPAPPPAGGRPAADPQPPGPGVAGPRRARRGVGPAVVAVLVAFAAGVGGVLVGIGIGDDADTAPVASSPGVEGDPVATVPGPVAPDTDEPIAAVAEALSPAVVQIETPNSLGSGFIYDSEGLVLTAAHVVGNADDVVVRAADGTRSEGVVLGRDPGTDVAVVEIDGGDDLPVATLATGVDLSVGQSAVAIGSPFGLDQTVTAGIVSAVGRSTAMPDGGAIPAVQTDAPINSGNSGGALADLQGRVIGINDSIFTGSAANPGNVGIGFAIPIDIAKAVADKIVAGEPAETGFLGVRGADASAERAGALIIDVEGGSPAAAAGMGVDDVVIAVDARPVSSMVDLVARISTAQPGDAVTLTVVRDGAERELEVTLGTAPGR